MFNKDEAVTPPPIKYTCIKSCLEKYRPYYHKRELKGMGVSSNQCLIAQRF